MTQPIRIGLLRLVDSAPVLVAHQRGLFAQHGLDVEISVEPSWSNIADKMTFGLLDAAVMLPPLVLAAAMGLRGPRARLIVAMGLSQGGNTIVLGNRAAECVASGAQPTGRMILAWLLTFRRTYGRAPRFAVVHHFSTHNLLLRYWLAAAGADPARHIETVVVPPEQVVDALTAGRIEGFCAGAPWGDVAQAAAAGHILIGTSSIWPSHPEKCLALAEPWMEANPDAAHRLVQALMTARELCNSPEEAPEIAAMLAGDHGLGLPEGPSLAVLPGGGAIETVTFPSGAAAHPSQAHALWFMRQMCRWGWLDSRLDLEAAARQIYRTDVLVGDDVLPWQAASLPPLQQDGLMTK